MKRALIVSCVMRACIVVLAVGVADSACAGGDPGRSLFDDNFNNEPLDQPIAVGGAALGEPVEIAPDLAAIIRAAPRPTPSLELAQLLPGQTRSVRFEFLDDAEVTHGDVVFRLTLYAAQADYYDVYVREHGTSAQSFLSMALYPTGDIEIHDRNGSAGFVGTYTSAVDHQFVFKFHMDFGTYDVEMDSTALLTGRSHGVTGRGVGALMVGVGDAAATSSRLYVDRIHVTLGDGVFSDGFD